MPAPTLTIHQSNTASTSAVRQDREASVGSSSSGPNSRWIERASLFVRPLTRPITLCRAGLHDLAVVGIYHFHQTVKGRKYTNARCAACARESVRRSMAKKKAAA